MDKICDYSLCTGCGACSGICPKECVTLESNKTENGHIYPVIDNLQCIDCGLCQKVCPVNHPIDLKTPVCTYAAYNLNVPVCNSSSSGGLAYALGEAILARGGVVYGSVVEYETPLKICHRRIDSIEQLSTIQGSKYVQSEIDRNIYVSVKRDLESGKDVLFTGTGCQIAAIRNFLRKDFDNFYTVDIICHGVPSQQLFRDYISEKIGENRVEQLSFRDKSSFGCFGRLQNGKSFAYPLRVNFYMMGFLKGLYYRNGCYACFYAQSKRGGDITLGDFWGFKGKFSERSTKSKGTSVVLINTEKGVRMLKDIGETVALMKRSLNEAVAGNPQLNHPSNKHFAYKIFKFLYPIIGYKRSALTCLVREKIFYGWALPLMRNLRKYK